MQGLHWLMLFGAILGAWLVLFGLAMSDEPHNFARSVAGDLLFSIGDVRPDAAGFVPVTLMWLLMSAAMMLPTAIPAFSAYDDLNHSGAETSFGALVGGYLAVWFGFSVLASGLQLALFSLGLVSGSDDGPSSALSAGLLAMAGAYQFTALKAACLSKCRAPVTFYMQHWSDGPLKLGLRLGATCLGCCWALMLLAFVGGIMSLAFMGLATLIMTLEKLPDIGRWLSRPLGVALLGASAWVGVTGF